MSTDTSTLSEQITSADPIDTTETARGVFVATMETLAERITAGQAEDLAETLPDAASGPSEMRVRKRRNRSRSSTFAARVQERTERTDDPIETITLVRAVSTAVRDVADETELERTRNRLPDEFDLVFEPGQPMTEDEFLQVVTERLPCDTAITPKEATNATLETLADRVTGGQAGDLAVSLPRGVREPLTVTDERALEFGYGEFLQRIATDANVGTDDAPELARAVFGAIRTSTARREFEQDTHDSPRSSDNSSRSDRY